MMPHICINPLFWIVLVLSHLLGNLSMFFITYLALLMHESIHLWFLAKDNIPVRKITVEPFGISIETQWNMPKNAVVYLSAPIGNLLMAFAFLIGSYWFHTTQYFRWILANFSLGFVNLLPVLPLDGGRALLLFLEKRMDKAIAKKRMRIVSFFVLMPLISAILLLFLKAGGNLGASVILLFLGYTLLSGNRLLEYKKLRKTAFRSQQGSFQDTLVVEHLGVRWDYPAKKLLKKFRGNKYYVVDVFRDGILLKTITETQILNRILHTDSNPLVVEC